MWYRQGFRLAALGQRRQNPNPTATPGRSIRTMIITLIYPLSKTYQLFEGASLRLITELAHYILSHNTASYLGRIRVHIQISNMNNSATCYLPNPFVLNVKLLQIQFLNHLVTLESIV